MATCWNGLMADLEAKRLGDEEADEAALEMRRSEIKNETRVALMGTLADGSGDLSELIEAFDEAQDGGALSSLDLIDALRLNHAGLMRWAVAAIEAAAQARAEAYTLADLEADMLAEVAP